MDTSSATNDDEKHEPPLNRPFAVVTENRDSLKNKSFAEPPTLFSRRSWLFPSLRMYRPAAFQSQSKRDLVTTWHRTIKNPQGSVRTIPFGPAGKLSSQPRRSSRGANQKRAEVPTHLAPSLVQYASAHLRSRKMMPPSLRHAPNSGQPAAWHHRSDFGWGN